MPSTIRGVDDFDSLESQGLGDGQTWQDMTASRASGVTYTNSTGRPIALIVNTYFVSGARLISYVPDNVLIQDSTPGGSGRATVIAIVPNGVTYKVNAITGTIDSWMELR